MRAPHINPRRALSASLALTCAASLAGCRQDMHNQPKFYPQRGTTLFADGRSVRPQVVNTVARGQLNEDSYFHTGLVNGAEGNALPFPVTADVMARGQERYNVYCTPCHSRVGNGAGMIVERGYAQAGNFHTARLEAAPLGHFFNVITHGYGAMPDYSAQLTPEDRWAVVAYIKALQLSQKATPADVAAGQHAQPLGDIAEHEGLPANFAAEWRVPPTAVTGTPDRQPFVIPPGQISDGGARPGQTSASTALTNAPAAVRTQQGTVQPNGRGSSGYGATLPGAPGPADKH